MNNNSDTFCTDDDMSFDDEDDDLLVSGVIDELEHARIEITGMTNVRNDSGVVDNSSNNNNNNDWDAESYANDSIPLAKLRLCHTPEVEDDWTVQSDCNDSVTLTTKRWSLRAAQHHNCVVALQRIPRRRRASMGEVFVVEQQQQQQQLSSAVPSTESYRVIVSSSTMEESTTSSSSGATTTSESSDPVRGVARHKSMPLKAKSTPSTIVPMWRPHKTKTMARRFSNSNGSNCAA